MLHHHPKAGAPHQALDMPGLLDILAHVSERPRYAYMVLHLIAQAAGADGRAGPLVHHAGGVTTIRDWLCDALSPMAHRDPRRIALTARVRTDLARAGRLPAEAEQARVAIEEEVRARVRASGKSNVSRAVSELVRAGLLRRHYQGYRVDHHNRGAQRQAVYTLSPAAQALLNGGAAAPLKVPAAVPATSSPAPRQGLLPL